MRVRAMVGVVTVAIFVTIVSTSGGLADRRGDTEPNPYRTIENWAELPEGRSWGSTADVAIDPYGSIWVPDCVCAWGISD